MAEKKATVIYWTGIIVTLVVCLGIVAYQIGGQIGGL